MAFKMLCFLVLYKDLLIIKISITIPAPRLQLLLLLATHNCALSTKEEKTNRKERREEQLTLPTQPPPPRPTGNIHKMADAFARCSVSRQALRPEEVPSRGGGGDVTQASVLSGWRLAAASGCRPSCQCLPSRLSWASEFLRAYFSL